MCSNLKTERSVEEIMLMLVNSSWLCNRRTDIIIPNLSWGLLNHEADLVIINKSHYLTEIEIKRSLPDLRKDFEKCVYHEDEKVYNFYYCIPEEIRFEADEIFKSHQDKIRKLYKCEVAFQTDKIKYPAVIYYDDNGMLSTNRAFPGRGGRKLFLEEIVTLERLLSIRFWDRVEKPYKGKVPFVKP